MILWVSWNTTWFMVWEWYIPYMGVVSEGTVWENLTLGIPVANLKLRCHSKVVISGWNISCVSCFSIRVNWWLRIGITGFLCLLQWRCLRLQSRLLLLQLSCWVCNWDNNFRLHGLLLWLGDCIWQDVVHELTSVDLPWIVNMPFVDAVFEIPSWNVMGNEGACWQNNMSFGILSALSLSDIISHNHAVASQMSW